MATLFQSKAAKGVTAIPYPGTAGGVVALRTSFTFPSTIGAGDIVEMGVIPAGCRLIDAILDADDLDTGGEPAITLDVGIMSGSFGVSDNTRTCGSEIFAASTVGQAGGLVRPTAKGAARIAVSGSERAVGIKVAAAAATAAEGTVGLTLIYATE